MENGDNFDEEDIAKLDELRKLFQSGDPSKVPSTKELLEMLEGSEISEEMKENMKEMLTGNTPKVLVGYPTFMAIGFAALIFSIICKLFYLITRLVLKDYHLFLSLYLFWGL